MGRERRSKKKARGTYTDCHLLQDKTTVMLQFSPNKKVELAVRDDTVMNSANDLPDQNDCEWRARKNESIDENSVATSCRSRSFHQLAQSLSSRALVFR